VPTFNAAGLRATLKSFLEGPTLFLHHAVPLLEGAVAARGGTASVINITSVTAQRHHARSPIYSMAKAAVDVLTKSAAGTLGPKGIRVNSVAPGAVFTELLTSAGVSKEASDGVFNELGKNSALGRAGQPQEVASLVSVVSPHRVLCLESRGDGRHKASLFWRRNGGPWRFTPVPQVAFLVDHSKSAWMTGAVYVADGGALATGL
jgi:NAD(P)-dependent dehydrogenase (short-subunit alcohol dehydrogenase family)